MAKTITRAKAYPTVMTPRMPTTQNDLQKNKGSFKTTTVGAENDGGAKEAELNTAAKSIYDKAVRNSDKDGMGDHALQNR
jgi:hypothetical protein